MKEYGSDFHYIQPDDSAVETFSCFYPEAVFYASGRLALIDLYQKMKWNRIWVPDYFCYEVLGALEQAGLNLEFYTDYPLFNDDQLVLSLPFKDGDVLFRVNYFGLRSKRGNSSIPVPVIEDHTHDLIGDWARNSDADWCIASLRKTLPLAEGGVLWSPKGFKTPATPKVTESNEVLASRRWNAMRQKAMYLDDEIQDKSEFRAELISTEEQFNSMKVSALDAKTSDYIERFDLNQWYLRKRENWSILKDIEIDAFRILEPENPNCNPFSLTLLFNEEEQRNHYRQTLINKDIYPAILWAIPPQKRSELKHFSTRVLSIHCDARYGIDDMIKLRDIITDC